MEEFSEFAHDLRRKAGVQQALRRLDEDFGLAEPLVVAAAWLGSRGVSPEAGLAARLQELVSSWRKGARPTGSATAENEDGLLLALGEEIGWLAGALKKETLPGWFVLIAPGSVMCLEQSYWLESIRNACLQPGV